ncbi:glycosyltransferase family 2 protein [Parabacteroides sp. GYB001]|uniref:glycosyltransferase family 2 protein n=1 Tax=Parabacteroides leei TaxID=2939491 RepID=UPI002017CFFD|nr:glycosyltransferase family 2 protein [Parabacteroides leei]MCL3853396.1 glycosyltransferase family 2 protein [Parabacteroides leei]
MIRISVFIVTYNQEMYVAQTIESILQQSVKPDEIVISDDCSQDGTWNIIQSYQAEYPEIIKAYRNDPNVGIFRNFNETTRKTTGNLVTCVAGDDFIKPGYFEHVVKCVKANGLNPDKDSFIIVPNVISLHSNGLETKHTNIPYEHRNLLSYRLRGLIDDRYGFVSRRSLDNTDDFIENIGLHGDFVWCFDRFIKTDKILFIDGYYPVYRQGVGIVSRTKEIDASKSLLKAIHILLQKYGSYFNKRDRLYIEYLKSKNMYISGKSISRYFILLYYTLLNTGNFGTMKKQMKALLFVVLPSKLKKVLFRIKYLEAISR